MVHRNQHIVVAFHLVVSMNVWLLYDLKSSKNDFFFSNVSNNWLMFTNTVSAMFTVVALGPVTC